MRYDRREFLKIGCLSLATLAGATLFGCSSQGGSSSSAATTQSSQPAEQRAADEGDAEDLASATSGDAAVVYFSCTGNTEAVAEKIAIATSGALMRIEPAQPYASEDLDYNSDCRANAEQKDPSARPEIASPVPDVSGYDVIYLGYPIWWGAAPKIVLTFLEGADLDGKTVIPFCTSGSSGISGSISAIEAAAPGANWLQGERFSASVTQEAIDSWVAGLHG